MLTASVTVLCACSGAAKSTGAHDPSGAGTGAGTSAGVPSDQGQHDAAVADGAVMTTSSDAALGSAGGAATSHVDAATADAAAMTDTGRACKRGVAYNHEVAGDAAAFGTTIGWWYNWSSSRADDIGAALGAADVEFVPMIWTGPPKRDLDAQALIASIPEGAKYLLAFNEPNFGGQASLTPEQAAAAWPALEEIADARNLKLVSPAVNYCGGDCNQTDPFKWLDAFFAACPDCRVDYVAFHWYACSLDALKWAVGEYEKKYARPVWLTEFACLDDPGDHSAAGQLAYMQKAVPFLESDPLMFRYAWFIGRSSSPGAIDLFADTGKLTTLGQAYAGFESDCE